MTKCLLNCCSGSEEANFGLRALQAPHHDLWMMSIRGASRSLASFTASSRDSIHANAEPNPLSAMEVFSIPNNTTVMQISLILFLNCQIECSLADCHFISVLKFATFGHIILFRVHFVFFNECYFSDFHKHFRFLFIHK